MISMKENKYERKEKPMDIQTQSVVNKKVKSII